MEDPPILVSADEAWADQFAQTLSRQRSRVEEFLAAQRARLDRAETELADQIEQVSESADRDRTEAVRAREETDSRTKQLDRQAETLHRLREELEIRQAEWDQVHQRTLQQYQTLSEQIHSQQEEQVSRLSEQLQKQIDEQCRRLEQQTEKLQAAGAYQEELTTEIEAGRCREAELSDELEALRRCCDQLEQCAANDSADDFQRRFEMAMDDLHELKARNSELEAQLAEAQTCGRQAPVSSGESLDWESEKRRILDAWEAESDEDAQDTVLQRTEIEDLVKSTDKIMAEKEREISDLKKLLAAQSSTHDAVAVGAAAVGKIVDSDAVVQEERQNLQRLQEELEEKRRQAEIDNSIERAKIARHRREFEEKVRAFQEQGGKIDLQSDPSNTSAPAKRGQWLARLGLKDPQGE